MMKSNILKVTSFLVLLPVVTIYFNNLVKPSDDLLHSDEPFLNVFNISERHSHQTCFIPHLSENKTTLINTPDFGAGMGKYIKDNFVTENDYKIKTVVIDAGHGGRDRGAKGRFLIEKDIALNIALRLGNSLAGNFPGIKVLYTRSTDVFVPLNDRAYIANSNDADLFISIHCNYMPDGGTIQGSETYVMGLHTAKQNLNVAKRENASILYEDNYEQTYGGYDPHSPEGHIILSMYQNAYLEQSILLANTIEHHLSTNNNRHSRGVKQAGFVVLKQTTMPSVLVETGYLSNYDDEQYLASETGQSNMALSILKAFMAYKQEVESNTVHAKKIAEVKAALHPIQVSSTTAQVNSIDRKKASESTPADHQEALLPAIAATTPAKRKKTTPPSERSTKPVSKGMAPTLLVKNDQEPTLTKEEIEATEYKVLLASSGKLLDTSQSPWQDVKYSVQLLKEGDQFKYLVIGFNNKEEAVNAKNELRKMGFSEAFVVAYRNGKRIK